MRWTRRFIYKTFWGGEHEIEVPEGILKVIREVPEDDDVAEVISNISWQNFYYSYGYANLWPRWNWPMMRLEDVWECLYRRYRDNSDLLKEAVDAVHRSITFVDHRGCGYDKKYVDLRKVVKLIPKRDGRTFPKCTMCRGTCRRWKGGQWVCCLIRAEVGGEIYRCCSDECVRRARSYYRHHLEYLRESEIRNQIRKRRELEWQTIKEARELLKKFRRVRLQLARGLPPEL